MFKIHSNYTYEETETHEEKFVLRKWLHKVASRNLSQVVSNGVTNEHHIDIKWGCHKAR